MCRISRANSCFSPFASICNKSWSSSPWKQHTTHMKLIWCQHIQWNINVVLLYQKLSENTHTFCKLKSRCWLCLGLQLLCCFFCIISTTFQFNIKKTCFWLLYPALNQFLQVHKCKQANLATAVWETEVKCILVSPGAHLWLNTVWTKTLLL